MRRLLLTATCLLGLKLISFGQAYQHLTLNAGVQAGDSTSRAALATWDAYLGASAADKPGYWAADERTRYAGGDLLLHEGFVRPSIYGFATRKVVLSLARQADDLYLCRTQFYWKTGAEPTRQLQVLAIVSVCLQRERGHWVLRNYLPHATRRWPTHQVGLLTYRVPPGYQFQRRKARQAAGFLAGIFRDFDITPFPVTYYLAPDCDALQHLRGFEYVLGMGLGGPPVCGFYDEVNHLVYAGGQGEAYLHELAHVINASFPQAHPLLLTGFAGLKGGHYGHSLRYHKDRVRAYLATHAVDLTDPLAFTSLDAETNPQYVMGAIFCELALEQGGLPKLKALFRYGTNDADFYRAIEQELHLRRADLPAVVTQRLLAP